MVLCKFFKYGECQSGDKCKWTHKMCHSNPYCGIDDCPFGHSHKSRDIKPYHESNNFCAPSAKELQEQIPNPLLLFEPITKEHNKIISDISLSSLFAKCKVQKN
jgi:hypothetical protein